MYMNCNVTVAFTCHLISIFSCVHFLWMLATPFVVANLNFRDTSRNNVYA